MPAKRATIFIPDHLSAILSPAGGASLTERVADVADRYAVAIGSVDVAALFTAADIAVISSAILGTLWQPAALIVGGIAADVQDMEGAVCDAFGVDQASLVAKLNNLTVIEQLAIVEHVERT